jgi:site-specific DNA-adenine methylase
MYIKLIVSFSEDESNDLKDQLIGLEQTLESEKERLNGQLQQLKTEYQEKNDKLSAELTLTSKYQVTGDVLKTEIITLYLVNCLFMV